MLADYPVIVDYNFSPVQSPLFHRDVSTDDDIFVPGQRGEDLGLPIADNTRLLYELPLLLDDDDVSSLCASIQYSEPIDVDGDHRETLGDGKHRHGDHIPDRSIPGRGVDDASEEEGIFGSVGSDYLNNGYLSTLQDSSLIENVSLDLLHSVEGDLDLCLGSNVEVDDLNCNRSKVTEQGHASLSSSSTSSHQRQKQKKKKTEDKRWSEMDEEEKEEVADHLSSVLRSLLGPRERMEVMAIISQEKRIKLSDKDFVIESHMLSESTLAKLETFLEENEVKGEVSDSELIISQPERKRNGGNAGRRKCTSLPASPQHRGSFAEGSSSLGTKKRSKRQKSLRAFQRRTRKEYRQASKERRSGLFNQEEVLTLSQSIKEDDGGEEEEEIDILG